jgi:CheY-like chemotaxis protein
MNTERKRILLIDDELFILKSTKRILEDKYDVSIAVGGKSAYEMLMKDNKFDLIISDISMPDIGGVELYKIISSQFPGLEKKIIFMTGFAYTEEINSFLKDSKNYVIDKPFDDTSLYHALNTFFSK